MKNLFYFITSVIALSLTQLSFAQDTREIENESSESILAREKFIYERRAGGPGMVLPPFAYSNAIIQREQMLRDNQNPNSPTQLVNWITANPTGLFYLVTNNNYIAGRTNSIAFHPTNANIMYHAAAQGGVWKTINGGVNWTPITEGLTTLASGDVVIDPSNPNILYYGTGELNYSGDSQYGDGLFKSTDAGATWTKIATSGVVGTRISQIAIDPSNTSILYLSGNVDVYKSTNGGLNWTPTNAGANANCVFVKPTNTQIIIIAVGGTSAGFIKKSINGGTTWTTLSSGLPSGMGRIQLAPAPSNFNIIYASIAAPGGALLGLYRTTDEGATWTLQASSPNYLSSQGWYDNAVCVHPTNPDLVVVGGLDCYVSTTGGTGLVQRSSWSTGNSGNMCHADIHRMLYNGTVLFCCSDGGVYKSTNDGTNWTDLNRTISTLQFQSADYDATALAKIHGGCQDNNKQYTLDGGANWVQRTTGDGGYTVIDPVTPTYIYGSYVLGSIQRSANSGTSYSNITPSGSSGGLFYDPYEMAPGDHLTIVFGRADLWKTTNAQTVTTTTGWTQIGTTTDMGGSVSAIGISATNINKIYAGTSNGRILVTTNNGTNWSVQAGFPYVSDLICDPANDNICYATLGGTGASHVRKTTNSGANWNDITGNLPSIAANAIVLRTGTPRILVVGTDLGVFNSYDEGATWTNFNNGMPAVEVYDLKYKQANGIILAATHGRGCWTFNLESTVGIDPLGQVPETWSLSQNYPNPFNPTTRISFDVAKQMNVKLVVFDILGNEVQTLVNQRMNAGHFEIDFNASGYASGIYFYKIEAGDFIDTKKMILIK